MLGIQRLSAACGVQHHTAKQIYNGTIYDELARIQVNLLVITFASPETIVDEFIPRLDFSNPRNLSLKSHKLLKRKVAQQWLQRKKK
jgi:hypothetical protein